MYQGRIESFFKGRNLATHCGIWHPKFFGSKTEAAIFDNFYKDDNFVEVHGLLSNSRMDEANEWQKTEPNRQRIK